MGGEYNQNILCTSLKNVIMNVIIKCNYCMQIKAEKETKKSIQMLCVNSGGRQNLPFVSRVGQRPIVGSMDSGRFQRRFASTF